MIVSADPYRLTQAILKLFPQGALWEEEACNPQSDIFLWTEAFAQEVARVYGLLEGVLEESYLQTAVHSLDLWERGVGLPSPSASSTVLRRQQVQLRIFSQFEANRLSLQSLASEFGYRLIFEDPVPAATFATLYCGQRMTGVAFRSRVVIKAVGKTFSEEFCALVRNVCSATTILAFETVSEPP